MNRNVKASAVFALAVSVAGVALTGCDEGSTAEPKAPASAAASEEQGEDLVTGTQKIQVEGSSVNVSCTGEAAEGKPVIILLHGGGDSLDTFADLQKTLGEQDRVCSYDRLGAGASDQPDGPQSFDSTGAILTGVIDQVAGDAPVVLAGHSLGGLIAGRYAPEHTDRVAGLVLLDATSPTQIADFEREVPADATGPAAEVKAQTLAIFEGQSPEQLVIPDAEVGSAGDIPVEVIQHGKPYLSAIPEYGAGLEQAWADGQEKWLALSSNSNLSSAANSEHYIHVDEPDVAIDAIQRVVSESAKSE
ncbi:alpha/beta fold hydrolase [Prauserella cavernicola]|uniref:Alpha/beta fold hydrolase n=1 Tax=Prauserella cavernicola TaxID=2800127 RepID=A0A934QZ43_9PSEU|nr:alpha/beta fold hydrolase [Prauserella cavernicola]MBK1789211.1 alpha/beta fold hydrolase [Prauserella cavernicola]